MLLLASCAAHAPAQDSPAGAWTQLAGVAAGHGLDPVTVQVPSVAAAVPAPACGDEIKKRLADIPETTVRECLERAWRSSAAIGEASPSGAVSDSARRSVGHYVDVWAYLINKALRKGDSQYLDANRGPLTRLDRALEDFPVFRGIVFRGSAHPPAPSFEPGSVFRDPAFVSTSLDPAIAEHYAGADGYITVIFSQSGRLLSYDRSTEELSAEKEVLIPRGRSFRVLKADQSSRGLTVVLLVEL